MFLKYNKWALLWAMLIFILCAIPGKDIPTVWWLELLSFDKVVHASIFFVFVILFSRGFSLQTNFQLLSIYPKTIASIIGILYGGLLELMQGYCLVDRSADIADFIANTFGCLMGVVLFEKIKGMRML